jgi:hypothetical protein
MHTKGVSLVRRLWPWLYAGLFAVGLLSGAGAFGKEDWSHTNIDWYFVAISLVLGVGFPFLAMWQSRTNKLTPVPAPSFSRGPRGGWWRDPFQWLRICILSMGGSFVGALSGLSAVSGQGAMAVYWKAGMVFGFLAGDYLARRAFANEIA